MNISSGGALSVEFGSTGNGHVDVGLDNGTGLLNVAGILEVEGNLSAPSSGNAASTVTLSGTATVSANRGFFDKNFIIDGGSITASFADRLILGGSGTHTWRIPAAGASTLSVGGNVDLGGTLQLEFPDGTPSVGSTWNLVDSAEVDDGETVPSGFDNIDQSLTGVSIGQRFVVDSVAGGSNGVLSQLKLEQHPVLVVSPSGATEIRNYGSTATIGIDVYTISSSAYGSLDKDGWASLADADPNSGWVEANPTVFDLTEVNVDPNGTLSLAGNSAVSLGNAVSFPTPTYFAEPTEDIRFRYAAPDENRYTEGTVVYSGPSASTLTLFVDPNTGEAAIQNGTKFSPKIDAYRITSATESLDPNNGAWNSLEDQNPAGDWSEASPDEGALSELLTVGSLKLDPNDTVSLGSPFQSGGVQDLVFQFALVTGGDFNGDGRVDSQDFLLWQRNPSVGDLSDFEANYGTEISRGDQLFTGRVVYGAVPSALAAVTAVPEPMAAALAACRFCFAAIGTAKKLLAAAFTLDNLITISSFSPRRLPRGSANGRGGATHIVF